MTAFDATSSGGSLEGNGQDGPEMPTTDSQNNTVFPTGSVVECDTVLNTRVTGQVLCFDNTTHLLVLKDSSGMKPLLRFLNLAFVEQVSARERAGEPCLYSGSTASPQQVQERVRKAEIRRRASLLQADVSVEGQHAFLLLRKTLDDVKWKGDCISVLDKVLVRPPYSADSIDAIGDPSNAAFTRARDHVRKILLQRPGHQARSPSDDAPADPSPSSH